MKQACINTYIGGINQDISNLKKQNDTYYSLQNGRRLTQDGNTSAAISNVIGNQELRYEDILINNQVGLPATWSIVGYCMMRNDIVLFSSSQAGNDAIYIVKYDYTTCTYRTRITLFDDTSKTAKLNFGTKIHAIGRYETEAVRHVYFVDGTNMLRCINVTPDVDNTTGLIKDEFNSGSYTGTQAKVVGQLEMLQDMTLTTPQFTQYTSGSLYSGVIQYAYRLYNLNGSISMTSPTSVLIPLSELIDVGDTLKLRGNSPSVNTGKGVIGTIEIKDTSLTFDRIEILALLYEQLNGIPTINIVDKKSFVRTGTSITINFVDDGIYTLGQLTPEEFAAIKSIYIPQTIAVKDDRLFLGNINEEYFDIADSVFDARSYRYSNGFNAVIYQKDTTYYTVDNVGNWTYSGGGSGISWSIPSTKDCINDYNDISKDGSAGHVLFHDFIFQKDGTKPGGSGKNIEYEFDDSICYKINNTEAQPLTFNAPLEYSGISGTVSGKTKVANYEYILGMKRGFQRDEIYRFGIIFYDSTGRQSFVKWIGDIRMPNLIDSPHIVSDGTSTYAVPLQVKFTVSNVPTNPDGTDMTYQIVYVKREAQDRTVLANGSFGHVDIDVNTTQFPSQLGNITTWSGGVGGADISYQNNLVFRSPEITFGNTIPNVGLFYETYNELMGIETLIPTSNPTYVYLWSNINAVGTQYKDGISYTLKVQPTTHIGDYLLIGTDSYINVNRAAGQSGTSLVISPTTSAVPIVYSSADPRCFISNLKRAIIGYGGNTYSDRASNTYISASDVTDSSTLTTTKGDTFVCYFDMLEFQMDRTDGGHEGASNHYIPCESSINLNLRQDDSFNRVYAVRGGAATYLNEVDNKLIGGVRLDYSDLYIYNTTYSTSDISKAYIARPFDFNINKTQDVLIRYSNIKLNGESEDSWLKYLTNNYNEVDSIYGSINRLINFKNEIYCFQESGFLPLPINQQVIETSDIGVATVLGTGTVLPTQFNYNIGSAEIGIQRDNDIITSGMGMYWIDTNKKKLYRFNGQVDTISDIKGISGYLRGFITTLSTVTGIHNNKYAEILFTMVGEFAHDTATHTLVYSEILDNFSGWYDCKPTIYIKTYDRILSSNTGQLLWEHDKGNYGQWYGTYYPTILEVAVNGGEGVEKEITKQFDNIEYQSEVYDIFGNDKEYETVHYVSAENSYYSYNTTGDVQMVAMRDGYTLDSEAIRTDTYPLPANTATIRRRNRKWYTLIPRVYGLVDTIMDSYRFRDNYIKLRLKFINGVTYRKLVIHDITTYYNLLNKY